MSFLKWKVGGGAASNATAGPSTPVPARVPLPADLKRFGLENFGNTCYANSILQSLYYCAPFRDFVLHSHDPSYAPNAVEWLQSQLQPPQPPTPALPPAPIPVSKSASSRGVKRPATTTDARPATAAATTQAAQPVDTPGIPSAPPTLFSALRSLFFYIAHNTDDKGTISPHAFVSKVRKENEMFRPPQHQDAHEFMNFLLNRIVEDIETIDREREQQLGNGSISTRTPTTGSRDDLSKSITSATSSGARLHAKTFVHALFEGVLTSETRCLTCENVSSRDESFLDLSIDIEQNSSVTACLRSFSASETLCQRNKFFCDSCCGLQEAEKRMKIKKLPNVLALHLKRFKYQEDTEKYVKLAYRVAFPFELRLFNTVDDAENPDRLYELFAIVVHIGAGPHHGHYIAIVKTRGTWLTFDDNTVEPIKESEIPKYFGDGNSGAGYVLFYQAVDLDRERLGLPPKDGQVSTPVLAPVNGHVVPDILSESPEHKASALPSVDAPVPAPAPAEVLERPKPRLDIPAVPHSADLTSSSIKSEPSSLSAKSPGLFKTRKPSLKTTSQDLFPSISGDASGDVTPLPSGKEKDEKDRSTRPWFRKSLRDKSRKARESISASEAPVIPPRTPTHTTFASDSEASSIPVSSSPNPQRASFARDEMPHLQAPGSPPPSAFHRRPSVDVRRGSFDTLSTSSQPPVTSQHSATASVASTHHPTASFSALPTSSQSSSRPSSTYASHSRPTSPAVPLSSSPAPLPLSSSLPLTDSTRMRKNSAKAGFRKIVESVTSSSPSATSGALSESEVSSRSVRNRLSSTAFSPPTSLETPPLPLAGDQFSVPDVGASPKPAAKSPGRKMSLSGGLRVLSRVKDKDKDKPPFAL